MNPETLVIITGKHMLVMWSSNLSHQVRGLADLLNRRRPERDNERKHRARTGIVKNTSAKRLVTSNNRVPIILNDRDV